MATRTRKPVPPVEPTDDVAPLVADPAPLPLAAEPAVLALGGAAGVPVEEAAAVISEVAAAYAGEPALPTRFVIAENADLGARAVLARTALADWPGWVAVEDLPDGELPQLPAHTEA